MSDGPLLSVPSMLGRPGTPMPKCTCRARLWACPGFWCKGGMGLPFAWHCRCLLAQKPLPVMVFCLFPLNKKGTHCAIIWKEIGETPHDKLKAPDQVLRALTQQLCVLICHYL